MSGVVCNKMSKYQKTLVLIKPDAVNRGITGKILSEYEQRGLDVLCLNTVQPSDRLVRLHYAEHATSPTFDELVASMAFKKVQVIIIAGPDAITRVRSINGVTDPNKANSETIRAKYGSSMRYNCVHASDSEDSAKNEIELWTKEFGLVVNCFD